MDSKRRDRRQRRIEVKQALQQGSSSKRLPSVPDAASAEIRQSRNMPEQGSAATPPTNSTPGITPATDTAAPSTYMGTTNTPIPKFATHAAAHGGDMPRRGGAQVFAFANKTATSTLGQQGNTHEPAKWEPHRRSSARREQPSYSSDATAKRVRRASSLAAVTDVETPVETPAPPRLRSLPTPVPLQPRAAAKPSLLTAISLYTLRLMVLGIGIGVITGTFLHHWNPTSRTKSASQRAGQPAGQATMTPIGGQFPAVKLTEPIAPLTSTIKALIAETPELTSAVMVVNAETGAYVDIDSTLGIPAASTIKVPILVAFFQDVDAGKIRLNEALTMRADLIATGSGEMQYQPAGTKFTAWETAVNMIVISDNTATNMLIDRLGGLEVLSQRFKQWGMTTTAMRSLLPDLSGTNTTSARDLADLMLQINQGKLVSPRSRDRILSIMQRTRNNSLLPQGIGKDALISHKTGDIGSMVGDVGIVDMPNGKRYVVAVLVKRPYNDGRANDLISRISQATYDYLSKPWEIAKPPTTSPTPSPSR
jgi:beta-lactamase class A